MSQGHTVTHGLFYKHRRRCQPPALRSTTRCYTGKTENTAAVAINVGETISDEGHRACTCEFLYWILILDECFSVWDEPGLFQFV